MPEPSRTAAQERADEIHVFGEELARLEREGVVALTPAQRAKYPDRTRYAIVQGKVRSSYQSGRGAF